MFKPKKLGPIFIHVTPTRWDSYGETAKPRVTNFLFEYLKRTGGISDSVAPGWYDFSMTIGLFKIETSLVPHVE